MTTACRSCNATLTGREKFCPHCGAAVGALEPEVLPAQTVTCPRCGQTEIPLSAGFCPRCGLQRTVAPAPVSGSYGAASQRVAAPASGMSKTARNLWIVSIAVVVILFVCCVILAYTSEVRLSPSAD